MSLWVQLLLAELAFHEFAANILARDVLLLSRLGLFGCSMIPVVPQRSADNIKDGEYGNLDASIELVLQVGAFEAEHDAASKKCRVSQKMDPDGSVVKVPEPAILCDCLLNFSQLQYVICWVLS